MSQFCRYESLINGHCLACEYKKPSGCDSDGYCTCEDDDDYEDCDEQED